MPRYTESALLEKNDNVRWLLVALLPVRVLLRSSAMHSQEWLCYQNPLPIELQQYEELTYQLRTVLELASQETAHSASLEPAVLPR